MEKFTTLDSFLNQVNEICKKTNGKILFRGQDKKYDTVFPSALRNGPSNDDFVEFINYTNSYNKGYSFNEVDTVIDIMIEMAQKGKKTRLLDVTSNPLIALYNSVNNYDNADGVVYLFIENESFINNINHNSSMNRFAWLESFYMLKDLYIKGIIFANVGDSSTNSGIENFIEMLSFTINKCRCLYSNINHKYSSTVLQSLGISDKIKFSKVRRGIIATIKDIVSITEVHNKFKYILDNKLNEISNFTKEICSTLPNIDPEEFAKLTEPLTLKGLLETVRLNKTQVTSSQLISYINNNHESMPLEDRLKELLSFIGKVSSLVFGKHVSPQLSINFQELFLYMNFGMPILIEPASNRLEQVIYNRILAQKSKFLLFPQMYFKNPFVANNILSLVDINPNYNDNIIEFIIPKERKEYIRTQLKLIFNENDFYPDGMKNNY